MGIKARQIIDFLVSHSHSLVRGKRQVIPDNVIDQLNIWEREKKRIKSKEVVMMSLEALSERPNFDAVFAAVIDCANEQLPNGCIWYNKSAKLIAVNPRVHSKVLEFIESF